MELKITFCADDMHDRWILNEWCGVQFGQGLDEGDTPKNVNITMLDEQTRYELWEQYSVNS